MRTKIYLLLLTLTVSLCSVWAQRPATWSDVTTANSTNILANPAAADPGGADNPYEIGSASDLKKMADIVNATNGYTRNTLIGINFKLINDIDLNNDPWTPIGSYNSAGDGLGLSFRGNFNGDGHSIYNLRITDYILGDFFHYAGLFGLASYSTIKNLAVYGDAYITSNTTNLRVGLLAGTVEGGIIENCYAMGSINCTSGSYSGQFVGLLVGYIPEKGMTRSTIRNSYAVGTVTFDGTNSTAYIGGLVGHNRSSTVEYSYADVSVINNGGTNVKVGSLLGVKSRNGSLPEPIVDNSYAREITEGYGNDIYGTGTFNIEALTDLDNSLGLLGGGASWAIPGIPGHYPYLNDVFEDSGNLIEVKLDFNGGRMTVDPSIEGVIIVRTNKGNSIKLPDVTNTAEVTPPTGGIGEGWYAAGTSFAGALTSSPAETLTARYRMAPAPNPRHNVKIESAEGLTVDKKTDVWHDVEEGYDFKFFVTVDEVYNDSKLTAFVNGKQIEPYRTDYYAYYYFIWDIDEDKEVTLRLINEATSNDVLSTTNIVAGHGTVSISVAQPTDVQIVSITGAVVYNANVASETVVSLPQGLYIVKAGASNVKVVVR